MMAKSKFDVQAIYCKWPNCGNAFPEKGKQGGRVDKGMPSQWGHNTWGYFCHEHLDPGVTYEFSPEEFRKDLGSFRDRVRESLAVQTNPILNVLDELRETLKAKQADYAGTDPFNNFTESAATADITPRQAALTLLGVKLSRIRNLERQNNEAANEPLLDSYLDLAGYAIILYAMAKEAK